MDGFGGQRVVRHFFVTGLPRSRTAWMANFLTHPPVAFCYHDLLRVDPALKRLHAPGAKFVGDSDSALVLEPMRWVQKFPDARWVLINRPVSDCFESFSKWFSGKRVYPGTPPDRGALARLFTLCARLVDQAEKVLPNVLIVDFESLDEEETIRRVWSWCLPGVDFPLERWRMLNTFQVNVMPEKFGG